MVIHLYFGQKDRDLIAWKKALPKMVFSWYVREMIRADRRGEVIELPLNFSATQENETMDTKLYFTGKEEIWFIRAIPKYKRSKKIKEVVRRHLEANKKYRLENQDDSTEDEADVLQENGATADDDMSDEYRELLRRMSGQ